MINYKSTPSFEEAISKLNSAQRKAVETIDGPVMVIAGAGTGKTQILAVRIANIIFKTDTNPENILAITFTDAGVSAMRSRLVSLIGRAGSEVSIFTFHGLANWLIKNNPDIFSDLAGSKQLSEIERIDILESIIKETDLDILKPMGDVFYYLSSISKAIDELKREGLTPDEFQDHYDKSLKEFNLIEDLHYDSGRYKGQMKGKYQIQEKTLKKNFELLKIYRKYKEALASKKFYDFSDMIVELRIALEKNRDFRLILQEQFHYLLVDEHQDTNFAQNRIIELLADFFENPNLFVVGDEKQAIFRFQGASLQNFYYFKNRYPGAVIITLSENYRSSQMILDLAQNLFPQSVRLESKNQNIVNQEIKLASYDKQEVELAGIVRQVSILLKNGYRENEIAIIYRNNKDAILISDWLDRLQIPYAVESRQGLLENQFIKQGLDLLKLFQNPLEDEVLARVMHFPCFRLGTMPLLKILQSYYRSLKNSSLLEFLLDDTFETERLSQILPKKNIIQDDKSLTNYLEESRQIEDAWKSLIIFLKKIINDYKALPPFDALRQIFSDSGLVNESFRSNQAQTNFQAIEEFLNEAQNILSADYSRGLNDLVTYFELAQKHKLSLGTKLKQASSGKVRLLTAHASKGLEFRAVFVVLADDRHFGKVSRAELLSLLPSVYEIISIDDKLDENLLDDERRLFYVALTRAKEFLWISYSNQNQEGKDQGPSPFILELDQSNLSYHDTSSDYEFYEEYKKIFIVDRKQESIFEPEYLKELFLNQGLSVTALNNYLKSPWTYFFRNLIRLPETKTDGSLLFGTAIHNSLQKFFENRRHGENPNLDYLLSVFDQDWQEVSVLPEAEKKRYLSRGLESLSSWYENYSEILPNEVLSEVNITVYLDDQIKLTGKIDKIELLSDQDCIVVDYKTGSPKSRNEIIGTTKNSEGDYYRQLVFYKLLLRYYKDGFFNMQKAELDFVEPDKKGKMHKESFVITEEEVDDLEILIKQVSAEIMSGEFLNRPCDPEKCSYCDLVHYLKSK